MTVINCILSDGVRIEFYNLKFAELIYENGDYKIYKTCPRTFVHVFKNYAFLEAAFPNKKLIDALINKRFASFQNKFLLHKVASYLERGSLISYSMKIRAGKRNKKKRSNLMIAPLTKN